MTRDILMLGPLPEAQMAQLEKKFRMHYLWRSKDPEALLNEVKDKIQGMISIYNCPVSGRLIRALPHLEIIAHCAVGIDAIDMQAARERNVIVTNTPDVLTDDTADMAIGLTLAVMRRMVEADLYVRSGQWVKKGDMPYGRSLKGKTMGIVGLGRIGQAVAARAEAFGLKIVWHGPRAKKHISYPHYVDLINMAGICDILVLTCPYNQGTHHMVNAKVLKSLGKKGVLINIARGAVVNESDLVDALESGQIAGAGLDVFEHEPDVPLTLSRMDHVVLQPHRGSATHETRGAMAQLVVDNLCAYFDKAQVLTPV